WPCSQRRAPRAATTASAVIAMVHAPVADISSRVLASRPGMRPWLPVAAATTSGWMLERRRRNTAARLAAAALEVLLNAIEANDRETGRHVRRVARYALILGDAAGLSETDLRDLERVALFHDIGKIHEALFDVVHEHSRLTPAERRAIET